MAPVAPYTVASAFLEHASTAEALSYTVPTAAPVDETAPTPLLDQQDHALYSSTFFPNRDDGGDTTGFVLARVIEDAYTLELRWCAFSKSQGGGDRQLGQPDAANAFAELDAHPGTLPPVSFVFPSRLVPEPAFFVLEAGGASTGRQLQIFCVTEAGYLYTLTFPLPTLFYASETLAQGRWSVESKVESLEERTPVLLHGVDQDRVLIATAEGQLVCAELTANGEGGLIETELRSPSSFSMRSLLPSFSTRNLSSPTKGSFQAAASAASPSQILSLATIVSDGRNESFTLSFGVCRDRKLRVWRLETGACLRVIDLPHYEVATSTLALAGASHLDSPRPSSNTALLAPTVQPLVKLVAGTETSPYRSYLVLFSSATSSAPSTFFLYGMATDAATGELKELEPVATRPCSFHSANSLVDFDVVHMDVSGEARWTLWACWDNGGEMDVRNVDVGELDGLPSEEGAEEWAVIDSAPTARTSTWTAAFFDEQLREAAETVPEVFLQHIARPGRYPPSTLEFALSEYQSLVTAEVADAGSFLPEQFDLDYPTPLARAAAIVGSTVVLQQDAETGAVLHEAHDHALKLEWLRFVALLNESRAAALYPTSLAIDEQRGIAAVIGRDSLAVPIVREAVRTLHDESALAALSMDPDADIDLPPAMASDSVLRADILPLLSIIRTVESGLPMGARRRFGRALAAQLATPLTTDVLACALDLYETHLEPMLDPFLPDLPSAVAGLENPERAVEAFLRLLTAEQLPPISMAAQDSQEVTDLTRAVLAGAFDLSVEARYALAQGLVTLLAAVSAAENDDARSADGEGDFSSADKMIPNLDRLIASAFTAFHASASLRWLAHSAASPSPASVEACRKLLAQSEGQDGFVQRLGQLRMHEAGRFDAGEDSPVATYGLVNTLIRLPDYSPALLPASRSALSVSIAYAASGLFRSLGVLPLAAPTEIVSTPAHAVLAMRMHQVTLSPEALEWCAMWPASAGLQYCMGCSQLELGNAEAAGEAFGRAGSGFGRGSLQAEEAETLVAVLPPVATTSRAAYYIHLVSLCSSTPFEHLIARFAQLALDALDEQDEVDADVASDLWIKLFRSCSATGNHVKAYEVIMAIPFAEARMTCLAHFISVVCETGAASLLCTFSFAGLEADLERNLAFRARNSDPLGKPNYYKVLYAYHVAKGDYRSAGTVMYQEGRRLGDLAGHSGAPYRQIATLQCQNYLAATNALSLVPRDHAWVAVAADGLPDRASKRRKVAYRIPEAEFDPEQSSPALDVLELADIRREYSLTLARLELSIEYPELERTHFQLDRDTIVALFSQLGKIDRAFAAGCAFDVDFTALFENLAERCISLALRPEAAHDVSWITMAEEASAWEGSLSSKSWRLLERRLDRHDDPTTGRYRKAVLDYVLSNNRGAKPPQFLLDQLAARDLPALLRMLVRHDRLSEAYDFGLKDLQVPISAPAPFAVTAPLQVYEQLLAIPPGDCKRLSDDVLKQRQTDLRRALDARLGEMEKAQRQLRRT